MPSQALSSSFANCIANPYSSRGFRFRDTYSTDWTAALTLHTVLPVNQSLGNAGTYVAVPNGTFFAFLFRDPLRAIVTFVANPSGKSYNYTSRHYNAITNLVATTVPVLAHTSNSQPINILYLVDANLGSSTNLHPHSNTLYPGLVDGQSYVWGDSGATFTFAQGVSDTSAYIDVLLFDGQIGANIARTAAFSGSAVTYTTGQAGYFAFNYVVGTYNVGQTVSVAVSGSGDVFGHLAMPYVDTHLIDLVRVRVLSASILLSNVASQLNKEGSLYVAQFQTSKLWWENLAPTQIAAARNSYVGPMEKGVYGFLKPASARDFEYVTSTTVNNGVISTTGFDLTAPLEYVAVATVSVGVGTTFPGLDALVTYNHAIEFVTEDQFFEAELPMYTVQQVQTAMEEVSAIPQFYENPIHLAAIGSLLMKGASFLLRNATTIGTMVNTVLSTGTNMFSPPSTKKTTKPKPKRKLVIKKKVKIVRKRSSQKKPSQKKQQKRKQQK